MSRWSLATPAWSAPFARDEVSKNRRVFAATVVIGVCCGIIQLLALGSQMVLLPVGMVLAGAFLLLSISRNSLALVIFLVVFVEVWGLVPESLTIGNVKVSDIVLAMLIIPLAIDLLRGRIDCPGGSGNTLRAAMWILVILIGGQILMTTLGTGQGFWPSIKAAKPYLYYFSFLLVPIYAGTPQKVRALTGWMTLIASILALVYVLVCIAGDTGPLTGLVLGEANFVGLGTFTRVRSVGAPLIVAMMLYQFYRYSQGLSSGLEKLALIPLLLGTTVHFYRSVWVGILVGILAQASIEGRRGARNAAKLLFGVMVFFTTIALIRPEFGKMVLSRALSTYTEVEELSGSYGVRQEQVERWTPVLENHRVLGIGFLHHDSSVGQRLEAEHLLEGTGNYDIGWIDLLGRLGVAGTLLLGVAIYKISKKVWSPQLYTAGAEAMVVGRTLMVWIVVGIVSLPGYALLSSSGGILPISLFGGMFALLLEQEKPQAHQND